MKKINVAVVGLRFGGGFAGLYQYHPQVETVGVFDTDPAITKQVADLFAPVKAYNSFEEILADKTIDAVHLVTPFPVHEEQTVAVLKSGKHCACTVPMAMTLEGIQRIVDTVRETGKHYMMMETTLYTYQFLYVQEMLRKGELGKIQFFRGTHYQDMVNWPDYWVGLPPMHYGTHAIAPMTVLSGSRICKVHCFGSGTIAESLVKHYGNPYPVESALFAFENGLKAEATRSLFETARTYQEGLNVYGSKASFEWGFSDSDDPLVTVAIPPAEGKRGGTDQIQVVKLPDYLETLPEELRPLAKSGTYYDPLNPQESLEKGFGGGHHGSHPHLVHEFVSSIIEDRKPWIDEILGANITAAGICAHESAMRDGEAVEIPRF